MTTLSLPTPEQFRPEFQDRWQTEYQQQISRTEGLCDVVTINGEFSEFPLLSKTDSVRKLTKRFEETAPGDIETGKRRVTTDPFLSALAFDRKDQMKLGTLESPVGPSIANQRAEIMRNKDDVVVGQAGRVGGLIGQAIQVNEEGRVSYEDFDDAQYTIAANYTYAGGVGGPNIGLSYDKLTRLKTRLGKLNVRSQDSSTNNPSGMALLCGYSQIEDLIQDLKLNNLEHAANAASQVAEGAMVDVCGFTIRALDDEHLPFDEVTGIRTCIAFAKNAVKFGYNEMPTHEMDRLPTKTHTLQSVFYFDWGFGRIWDQGVWKLPCQEA